MRKHLMRLHRPGEQILPVHGLIGHVTGKAL